MRSFIGLSMAVVAIAIGVCRAAPEPAIVPRPGQWTVDVTFTHPQQIMLRTGADSRPRRFWYALLTITNKTGRDVDFYPKCELMTDTFEIIPAGKSVTPMVFEQIKIRHQSMYQFLEALEKVGNKILQGEDNTKDIAIIWPDFDGKAKSIKLFITGLSNETAVVEHPVAKDKDGKPAQVYLRKTLELNYSVKGDPAVRSNTDLAYKDKRWVMR